MIDHETVAQFAQERNVPFTNFASLCRAQEVQDLIWSEIENQLKFSPYISDAVVIGDRRKFLSCLVMIDHETVAQFAQERNVPFSNFASLCRAPQVQELIWGEIERVNRDLARVETVKAFRLIEQPLTAEDEELTPTMKLKRALVNVKYKDLIDTMYERSQG
jgi:long-chain acyl-CoA synthetase